jgi:hypothetical protein
MGPDLRRRRITSLDFTPGASAVLPSLAEQRVRTADASAVIPARSARSGSHAGVLKGADEDLI